MTPAAFFENPTCVAQCHYEALRAYYHEAKSSRQVAEDFKFSQKYFKKLRSQFIARLKKGEEPFFVNPKRGPKTRRTETSITEAVVALRKQNHSITDIKVHLHSTGVTLSLDTIDSILKEEGFAPLPKRTRKERTQTPVPDKLKAPKSEKIVLKKREQFITENAAGPLIFLPLIQKIGLVNAIATSGFPSTRSVSDVQYVLAFLALKLMGGERWSHHEHWNFDRALGLFSGLNVLPKSSSLSTYSYRVKRNANVKLLLQASQIFEKNSDGEFNLDFKTIPHWGDESVLEKHWSGTRGKAMKSLQALLVQNPNSGKLSYTNAEIDHHTQNESVLEFVDFWKKSHQQEPKMLIFDSKFTTYQNLSKLNQDGIKFLTLRRRGQSLMKTVAKLPLDEWKTVCLDRAKGKQQKIQVHERVIKLRHYKGEVREIIITGHGRERPVFLISNDFESEIKVLVKKYARRWLVEQEIAEQVAFFHLNHPSSSIVVKVDFDLTLSLIAHNLYRLLAAELQGFEQCTTETLYRKFLENGACICIEENQAKIQLKKKMHLPILLELPWLQGSTHLDWLDLDVSYEGGTVS